MSNTNTEYTNVINVCRDIFSKKTKDYGTAWRILRPSSLTDQIFIKAQRIRTIQEKDKNAVKHSEQMKDYEIGMNDINIKKEVPIWKILSNRYILSYPKLLEEDVETKKSDKKK